MSKPIITVENLNKKYNIGENIYGSGARTFRDLFDHKIKNIVKKEKIIKSNNNFIWALKDVNFEVEEGQVVGIIGKNGAGKSTLLKVISRITEPTIGKITLRGRVASLLEVGTGFNLELTGRENIYLNGAILGMKRAEINKKFDEIVEFAEVEKFIDTPVKRYSSGMYLRLAFSVAAHLEPEILIVDEVLAVGDADFQKKCLGKMSDVSKSGRTILFVSHNMQAIKQLCHSAILFRAGAIVANCESSKTIEHYLRDNHGVEDMENIDELIMNLPPDPVFRLDKITLSQRGQPINRFAENGKPIEIGIYYQVFEKATGLRVYFDLCDDQDMLFFRSFHDEDGEGIPTVEPGYYISKSEIPANLLAPILYVLRVQAGIFNVRTFLPEPGISIPLKVEQTGHYNRAYLADTFRGKFALAMNWKTEKITCDV